ncbi:MAG: xanthine dehydrogenase molybdopterin binding subunit [Verrucomicrobia bacterium]|nr:xanthine dehydrogenase molybdopterin binding subunit [Verrucomicrobiota bacterium]MBV8484699.1 xanthine dehydrogenase molybdopterin binding subunit [Verrucomicrobiota bacterium]
MQRVSDLKEGFTFELNGKQEFVKDCSTNITLLQYLRRRGLIGSKEGCAEGDCGACTVVLVDRDASGHNQHRAINSCLVPLPLIAGRKIVSVEGVATATQLHPIQQAMVSRHGSQCGYCTPGFIMSLYEAYHRTDLNEAWQLDDQLCGNLCRCTGYRPIREAAFEALAKRRPTDTEINPAGHAGGETSLAPIGYRTASENFFRPVALTELFELLAVYPDAQLVAGATELGLKITKLFQSFPTLISLEGIAELAVLEPNDTHWRVGAAVTLTQVWDALGKEFPVLASMLRWFGSRQIRNRATLGGNLATASPIGDSAPVLLGLDASLVLASAKGARVVPLDEFFVGYRKTQLQTGEIIREILIPRARAQASLAQDVTRFYKVSRRREMDISTVAGCFRIQLDISGKIRLARVVYGGVAPTPVRTSDVEADLVGKEWNRDTVAGAAEVLAKRFTPISDVRGSAEYRTALIVELWEKFFDDTQSGQADPSCHSPAPAGEADLSRRSEAEADLSRRSEAEADSAAPLPVVPELTNPHPAHESAHKHVSGSAYYTDDSVQSADRLEVWPMCSERAHARFRVRRLPAEVPGVKAVLFADDIPGANEIGSVRHDEPLLARDQVLYHGQVIGLVVGETEAACRAAANTIEIEYEDLRPILSIEDAIAANSFHTDPNFIRRGDVDRALKTASHRLRGNFWLGGQDHFYLETQAAIAFPGEDASMQVTSSTQHPSEVQHLVSHVLGVKAHQVVIESPRMGGGFGGKETQAAINACLAALAARHTGKSVRVRWNRDQDMMITGKRHPFYACFDVGYEPDGKVAAVRAELVSDGGWSLDLSTAVTDRALFHLDNAYYFPNVEFSGRVARTNVSSNTAFRGFGGPQGMLVMEEIMDRVARSLRISPELVRQRNLYHGRGETNTTPYGQEIEDNRIETIWEQLLESSNFQPRRTQIAAWNSRHSTCKRGLAITPVKFGISFTATHFNQAGAFVLIYQDGTIQVNHGGTEMGQGIHTNIQTIAASELGLTSDRIRVMPTRTDKVPNTSATAASSGTDLNGAAVRNACHALTRRLAQVAAESLTQKYGSPVEADAVEFKCNFVFPKGAPENRLSFSEVVGAAYSQRISLSATGFYRTPGIHYNRGAGRGKPFHYFAVGAAVTEVEIDGHTGMMQLLRVDILHDVGESINAAVNRGQIEGGFIQGMGWLTMEELVWDAKGKLLTHSPDTYKIPAIGDVPTDLRVEFLSNAAQPNNIYGSKAVGEPPLMLAISVREAIRDAVAAFGNGRDLVELASPATCEAIYRAVRAQRASNGATRRYGDTATRR